MAIVLGTFFEENYFVYSLPSIKFRLNTMQQKSITKKVLARLYPSLNTRN